MFTIGMKGLPGYPSQRISTSGNHALSSLGFRALMFRAHGILLWKKAVGKWPVNAGGLDVGVSQNSIRV